MLSAVYPKFRQKAFLAEVLRGYEALELLDRGRRIATVLQAYLPNEYPKALENLVASSRVPVKQGDPGGLAVLGFGARPAVEVRAVRITPRRVREGDAVTLSFNLIGTGSRCQRIVVDFRIHYVKANGSANPKVFKLKSLEIGSRETVSLRETISLKPMTTRRHYPGRRRVEVPVNGRSFDAGAFVVTATPDR